MFGDERAERAIRQGAGGAARDLALGLVDKVLAFAGSHDQADDITCMVLRYTG